MKVIATEYRIEISDNEWINAKLHDEGSGFFVSIKTENLEPDEIYKEGMVTLDLKNIDKLNEALKMILKQAQDG